MKKRNSLISINLVLIGLIALLCTSYAQITPKGEYEGREDPRELEQKVVANVEITVGTDMWNGGEDIDEYVTPLQVTIDNAGDKPIMVRYSEFALTSPEGHYYSALPLYGIAGDVKKPELDAEYEIFEKPDFGYDENFYIYSTYTPLFPTLPVSEYPFDADIVYYNTYYDWDALNKDLPTNEMQRKALPEGVLDESGILSGFLYFEKIDDNVENLNFRMDLVNANTGKVFGTVSIPLVVTE